MKKSHKIIGFTAGAMDLLHPGHLLMLEECKQHCDYLIVGLHEDPSIERPKKNSPIETIEERMIRLKGCKYVDSFVIYKTEEDLLTLLKQLKIDVRFVGEDHKGKPFTGDSLPIKIYWNSRSHNYSSTNLRNRIKDDISI